MLNSALVSLWLLMTQDTVIGPYLVPDILPESAEQLPRTTGDILYQDDEGTPYVLHLNSGAKIYYPILYDTSLPFEIRWTPRGLEALNSLSISLRVELPAPHIAEVYVGTLDYVNFGLPGAHWGLYFYSQHASATDQGYETIGVWPPREEIQNYFAQNYGVTNINDLAFRSSIRCGSPSPNATACGWKTADTAAPMKISLRYAPITIDPAHRYWMHRKADFDWAGTFDLNIDGTKNTEDLTQFQSWWTANDMRADWNLNGRVEAIDKSQFEAAFGGTTTEPANGNSDGTSGDGEGDSKIAGGCAVRANEFSAATTFWAFLSLILIFFLRRRGRPTSSRNSSPLVNRFSQNH